MTPKYFKHALFIYPYRKELPRVNFFPPLGLEIIAAAFKPYVGALDIVDLRREQASTRDFIRPETELIAFSVNWNREADFIHQQIIEAGNDKCVIIGGRYATENPGYWLEKYPHVDYVFRGDSEEAAAELCQGTPPAEIANLSYRAEGKIHHNPNRRLQPLRDDLYPDRTQRRYSYEIEVERIRTGVGFDSMSTSRGCPFNCKFCSFSRNPWGEKREWSARSPESVVEELSQIKSTFVAITDDLFTYDMDRVERICDLLLARGIRKKYIINARLEITRRPDVLKKMERAGFLFLMLGVESAHDKTLKSMRKGFNTDTIREHFAILRHYHMILHGYFILGNIGESVAEMEQAIPFAHELGLDTIALSMLRHSPYSGLEELVKENPEYHIAPRGKIYSDFCSVKQLGQLRRRLYREFYTPKQVLRVSRKGFRNGALKLLPLLLYHTPSMIAQIARARRHAHPPLIAQA